MAEKNIVQETFPVLGMSCASCSARVEKTLNHQSGVKKAVVNYASATATVEYDPTSCSSEALQQAVQAAGYDLLINQDDNTLEEAEEAHNKKFSVLKFRTTWAIILSMPVVIIGMFFMDMPHANPIMWALSTPVVFWLGRGFFTSAWKQLQHGSANMDTLVAISTGTAYLFSLFNMLFPDFWLSRGIHPHVYFEAASVIIAFILLGRLLEEKAKGNTSTAIKKLMGLQPKTVTIIVDEGHAVPHSSFERVIPIEQIRPGDIVLVKPGERIAVDGIVTEGSSYVDESMLSGEPVAVSKHKDAKVFAGTINQKGSFRFRAEKIGTDTLLAKIIHMVQDAQGSKAPVQQLVDNGQITREQAALHPQKNLITRALGVSANIVPEYNRCEVVPGDLLLLCTDGLTNMVPDAELALLLQESAFFDAPGVLVDRALKGGGQDNITVLLLGVETTEETNG